jgi:hypothetical protein
VIFRFLVAHCRWLARVPLLPQVFDAALLLWTAATDRQKLLALELLNREAVAAFGAELRLHRFGGTAFCAGGAELGHVHSNGLLDVLVGRVNRDRLVDAGAALPHHVFPNSGWISFWMNSEADVVAAIELLRLAHGRKP